MPLASASRLAAGVSAVASSMMSLNKKGPVKQRGGAVILSCAVDDADSSFGATDNRVPESLALDGIRDDRFRDHSVLVR